MPREPEFTVGTTVRLKSGGHAMLVEEVAVFVGKHRYRCFWMDTFGGVLYADYPGDELERVGREESDD